MSTATRLMGVGDVYASCQQPSVTFLNALCEAMGNTWARIFKSRRKSSHLSPDQYSGASPSDGVGYPVPYDGTRLDVTYELLKKLKSLQPHSGVYRINETTVMKTGPAARMCEAAAMRLVAEKTSIPIPKLLDAYVQKSDGYGVIIMEYVVGETLDIAWPKCTPEQQTNIVAQLQQYLKELRAIKGDTICAVDGSPCHDQFFPQDNDGQVQHALFSSEAEFHQAVAKELLARCDDSWSRMASSFVTSLENNHIVLTHNDLAPRNILIRDGKVAAILDWELCGYFPDYWEYTKCYLWNSWHAAWANERIPDRILESRPKELAFMLHARDIHMR